jgi:hypothetical protein
MTRTVTLAGYLVIATGMVVVQVAGLLGTRLPTLGMVLRFLRSGRVAHWILLAGWLWLGWHVFVRAHH